MSHALFDAIMDAKGLLIDEEVGDLIGIKRNAVVQYRNGRVTIGPAIILRVYDVTGWSIERIRELVADKAAPRAARQRTVKQIAAATRLGAAKKAAKRVKPPKSIKALKAIAPPAPAIPTDLPRMTITETPKWVSRVHRVL